MTIELFITILVLLQIKHFVIDFLAQPPYMYLNKGNVYHPGGWLHAGLHGIATWALVSWFGYPGFLIFVFELFAHYFIDWAKVNINKMMNWGPTTHEEFWYLMGADQFAHQLCYAYILWMLI